IGALQQDVFFDLSAAETTLKQVVGSYPNTRAADAAEFDLARAALMTGDLEEARLRFSRLEDRQRTGDFAELSRFKLAQIHFFLGEFDAAQALVDIIDVNTSTDVSNDAIELKILLMENRGPDSLNLPLREYARAVLAEEQRRLQLALDTLDGILARYPDHPLADDVRFLRASVLRSAGRGREAHDAFAELPLLHPQSYLADRAFFEAAEIQEIELADAEAAVKLYSRLLTEYPGSLLAPEARERIRRLRGSGA
ncbi:MAG: tetratricopeptide repeat protein, partial [Rhodothermales bacterium]